MPSLRSPGLDANRQVPRDGLPSPATDVHDGATRLARGVSAGAGVDVRNAGRVGVPATHDAVRIPHDAVLRDPVLPDPISREPVPSEPVPGDNLASPWEAEPGGWFG